MDNKITDAVMVYESAQITGSACISEHAEISQADMGDPSVKAEVEGMCARLDSIYLLRLAMDEGRAIAMAKRNWFQKLEAWFLGY
mgnify:CR=1 FL=1